MNPVTGWACTAARPSPGNQAGWRRPTRRWSSTSRWPASAPSAKSCTEPTGWWPSRGRSPRTRPPTAPDGRRRSALRLASGVPAGTKLAWRPSGPTARLQRAGPGSSCAPRPVDRRHRSCWNWRSIPGTPTTIGVAPTCISAGRPSPFAGRSPAAFLTVRTPCAIATPTSGPSLTSAGTSGWRTPRRTRSAPGRRARAGRPGRGRSSNGPRGRATGSTTGSTPTSRSGRKSLARTG